jgi:hypothetical protein
MSKVLTFEMRRSRGSGAMDSYNFWQDFFDTYQSLSDWMKALWLIVPPAFLLLLIRQFTHRRKKPETTASPAFPGRLVYSIYRDDQDRTLVFNHAPELAQETDVVLPDHSGSEAADGDARHLC